jgi:hypothetical protein
MLQPPLTIVVVLQLFVELEGAGGDALESCHASILGTAASGGYGFSAYVESAPYVEKQKTTLPRESVAGWFSAA